MSFKVINNVLSDTVSLDFLNDKKMSLDIDVKDFCLIILTIVRR